MRFYVQYICSRDCQFVGTYDRKQDREEECGYYAKHLGRPVENN